MELENKIKQKLRLRGFTEKQLLNNRGLIGATIDEVALMLVKKLDIHDVSNRYSIEDIERCVENWGMCKVEKEYIERFLNGC